MFPTLDDTPEEALAKLKSLKDQIRRTKETALMTSQLGEVSGSTLPDISVDEIINQQGL
jgi:hypothetical protein